MPTVGGECIFEDCYNGNPLVNVFALGVFRKDEIFYARPPASAIRSSTWARRPGATAFTARPWRSAEFTEESKQKRPNVQVGDPFLEKLLLEACLEAMKTGAIVAIQDMGAAGLTSSSCEMGSRGGVGIEIDLDLVPQRETGMTAYEMLLSESQERMLLVAEKGREDEVFQVFQQMGTGRGHDRRRDRRRQAARAASRQVVAEIPNRALADEAPRYDRPHNVEPYRKAPMEAPADSRVDRSERGSARACSARRICARKRWIWEQYDYMVRTNTIAGPGRDAAVVRVKETDTSIAMSLDGNGRYCYLDPREGAKLAVAECCRNLATAGRGARRRDEQSQLRQSGAPGDHGAAGGSHRGHRRSLRILRDADHRRQRQPLQRNARRRHLPDAGAGHHRPDEDGRTDADAVPERRRARAFCSAASGAATKCDFGGTRVRESDPRIGFGGCRRSSTWITKSASTMRCATSWPRGWPNPRTISAMAAWRWRWPNAARRRRAPKNRVSRIAAEHSALRRSAVANSDLHSEPGTRSAIAREIRRRSCRAIGVTMKERLQIGTDPIIVDPCH